VAGQDVPFALVKKAFVNGLLCLLMFGIPLFLGAGSLRFLNGWLFLGAFILPFLAVLLYFAFDNPDYFKKRVRGDEKERPQQVVMALLVLCALLMLLVSGLDYRFHWSSVPMQLVIASAVMMFAGFIMLFAVMKQNSFASRVIEVQRGQKVIDTGMYAVIRHPMYLAFTVIFGFAPLVLGSLYSLIPAAIIPCLISFRIKNEEAVLSKGLEGYDAYMKKIRYRLIPFVW